MNAKQEGKTYTFNSTQLRAIDVRMQPVQPLVGVPLDVVCTEARPVRHAAQAAMQAVRNIASSLLAVRLLNRQSNIGRSHLAKKAQSCCTALCDLQLPSSVCHLIVMVTQAKPLLKNRVLSL